MSIYTHTYRINNILKLTFDCRVENIKGDEKCMEREKRRGNDGLALEYRAWRDGCKVLFGG